MAHSVRWRIISEQDTNGFSKLFVCLLKGISTVLPVKPLQFDVEKPPVVDPKIVFFSHGVSHGFLPAQGAPYRERASLDLLCPAQKVHLQLEGQR